MKFRLTHRVSTILATTLATAALATGAATAAPATLEPAAPTAEPAATSIAGTCNTGSSAPLAALQNGSGGNLAAFLWPLGNGLNCLTGSSAAPIAAPADISSGSGSTLPTTTGSSSLTDSLHSLGCSFSMTRWDPATQTCVKPSVSVG
ncbi:hypothetical protein [Nocardia tengchongensis]|uniref:hypothetical protein n=1 Tax=Nocardia tengchongensis TaxID=2055889 RepID=UPI00368F5D39